MYVSLCVVHIFVHVCGSHSLEAMSEREELGNWTSACCPAATFREPIRGKTKWKMGFGGFRSWEPQENWVRRES